MGNSGWRGARSLTLVMTMVLLLLQPRIATGVVYYAMPISSVTAVNPPEVILQPGIMGSSTIYANGTSAKVSVSATVWLSGWSNRVKITIDHNDIAATLSNFPVLVYLSNSSGLNNADVSFIFDELQSDVNRKKIAVTTSNGLTQCYVEIEHWDDDNEQAWLWVKVPSISSSADTHLYLYYDKAHSDNTGYIGDVGSTPAEAVWDSIFKAVWHLGESTGGAGAMKDSTSNSNDGTDNGGPTLGATGKIGNAIHFDGLDDYIAVPDNISLHLGNGLTIEAWINIDTWGDWEDIVFKGGGNGDDSDYQFALVSTGLAWDGTYNGTWRTKYFPTSQDTGTWIYAVVTHDTVTVKCYRDGSEISSQSDTGAIYESTYQLGISREGAADRGYLDGKIDEVRIHSEARSAAWINASYESGRDELLKYELEERDIEDYVDNNTSNVDSSADKGTHGNFSAQQYGPDSIFDILTEEETVSASGYRVQQGDFLFQGTNAYIPLDYEVDITHAFVMMPNLMWQENVTAATSGDPAMNDNNAFVTAYLYNSTHIRLQRWSSSDGDVRIGWQVLECFDEEFTVQRGEKYLSSFTGQSTTDTIPNPVDPARSMAWHYWRTSYNGRDGRVGQFYSNVTDSITITFNRQGTTSVTGYLSWVVVEWNTSKIDHFAQGYVVGYGTDTSPFTASIGTMINQSQSILIFQTHAIGDDGLDTSTTAGYIKNSTHVAFYNYASAYDRGIKWYVIDFGSGVGSKQHNDHVAWGSTDYINDDALNPSVQLNRTLVWLSGSCEGDGTSKPRHTQWWVLNPMNSTHSSSLHYERRYGGQNREIAWQVLELPYVSANHELDLETQWTNVNYSETNEYLCIKTGTMDEEEIGVDIWNGTAWIAVFSDLTANSWNNVSVSSYLNSSTFTIRFKGGSEISDSNQDSWNIDAALLHVWTSESNYNYVLQVVNQVTDAWNVSLRVYDNSSIARISSMTISFHDGTTSDQIILTGGNINQTEGTLYDLTGSTTIYISITNLQASTSGISHLYVYLKILVPGTSTYSLYIITFEIT